MIRELTITDPSNTCMPWWPKVEWLKGQTRIEFKPGLNAIYGPNGTGKSTVIQAMARTLCCAQGGRQMVTSTALDNLGYTSDTGVFKDGALPVHDGSPVLYFDPDQAVGLFGGLAAFDDDFMNEGLGNVMFKGSSGQTTMNRIETVINAMHRGQWPTMERKVKKCKGLDPFLNGSFDKVGPTILLDEPSRSLDLRYELAFWKLTDKAIAAGVQVIMATHSVFPLNRLGTHYIETQPGYVDQVSRMVDDMMTINHLNQTVRELKAQSVPKV